jgi:hypothetical protein
MGQEDGYLFGQDNVSWDGEGLMLVNQCKAKLHFQCLSNMCEGNRDAYEGGRCHFFPKGADGCTSLDAQLEEIGNN